MWARLTAIMLKNPRAKTMIPEPMTIRQKGIPSDFWLVASLLRLPMMLFPRMIIARPKKLKPCELLNTGQFLSYHPLNSEHSETTRNMLDRAVMMCVAPSKKKNYCLRSALHRECMVRCGIPSKQ